MTPATDAIEALAGLANPFAAPSSEEDRLFADAMAAADAWHRARNPRYAALWDENTRPLLPVGLFKRADLATPVDDGGETLRSSGTTSGQGTPVFFDARSMARIRQGMLHIFMRAGYFDLRPANFLVLAPDPAQGDHPGYATAFTRFTDCAPQREVVYAVDADGQFSAARAWEALRRFADEANTLFVFGLTVWFEHLALAADAPVPLRGPLRGLTGGGWKGLARTLDRPEIVARLTAHYAGAIGDWRSDFCSSELEAHGNCCAAGRFHL
ncbi:MAG: hypothetical protein KC620_19940, partial [Myxococcales bacterium]|nr:hypothetical protein [Myxococcales bacterium]